MLKLVTGTTIAQGLVVLASPFLARLYAPEDFGALALFMSISSILGVVACLRYELAIMLPETDEEAANLLAASLFFALVTSGLTLVGVLTVGETVLGWLNASSLAPYLWLLPLTVLIEGVYHALNYWNSRSKKFGRLSVSRVTNAIGTIVVQLSVGVSGYATSVALICGNIIGKILSVLYLGKEELSVYKNENLNKLSIDKTFYAVKRYKKFPFYTTWSALLNTASWQLPAFMLGAFFSPVIVGYYAFGFRMLQMPLSLIGGAIGQVYYQRASVAYAKGELNYLVEKVFSVLVMYGMFPVFVVFFLGEDIFSFVFGKQWSEAGVYAQIMSVWAFFWFISSPMSNLFSVVERQDLGLLINVLLFVLRLISLMVGGYSGDPRIALTIFSIVGIFVYLFQLVLLMKLSGVSVGGSVKNVLVGMALFAPFGLLIVTMVILTRNMVVLLSLLSMLYCLYLLFIQHKGKMASANI